MKKTTSLFVLSLFSGFAFAQSNVNTLEAPYTKAEHGVVDKGISNRPINDGNEAVIWSEDFSSGIPAGWTNAGFDGNLSSSPLCKWEYRGASTTPNNGTGSRGAYASANDPIVSPSASNGFIIFDSDYLDNDGIVGNFGNGDAPAPHVGTLTTDSIDLTGHPYVELQFSQYARVFFADFLVAFSTDGGSTWPDTIAFNSTLSTNGASPSNDVVSANVSSIIGNQNNVRMRFIFDGRPGNANGNGYYFWMIDDIVLQDLPRNALKFTEFGGAPARDVLMNATNPGEGKFGVLPFKQVRPVGMDANFLNFGWGAQTNVQLNVEILDGTGTTVTTLTSSPLSGSLSPNDTADYNDMVTTTTWTPTSAGNYTFVYYPTSDSISLGDAGCPTDTLTWAVSDSLMSLDWGTFSNSFGTPNVGDDASEVGVRYDLQNDERLFGVTVILSTATVPGGLLEFEVYDTTGLDLTTGFASPPLTSVGHTITQTDVDNRRIYVDLTDQNGVPLYLNASTSYYVTMRMFSNAGANEIRIGNDQTVTQPGFSAIMYYTLAAPNRWYTGFNNSLVLNAPIMRISTCSLAGATSGNCMELGFEELERTLDITVGQNPNIEALLVNFKGVDRGIYNLRLTNLNGQEIYNADVEAETNSQEAISVSGLASGAYVLTVSGNGGLATYKVVIK